MKRTNSISIIFVNSTVMKRISSRIIIFVPFSIVFFFFFLNYSQSICLPYLLITFFRPFTIYRIRVNCGIKCYSARFSLYEKMHRNCFFFSTLVWREVHDDEVVSNGNLFFFFFNCWWQGKKKRHRIALFTI